MSPHFPLVLCSDSQAPAPCPTFLSFSHIHHLVLHPRDGWAHQWSGKRGLGHANVMRSLGRRSRHDLRKELRRDHRHCGRNKQFQDGDAASNLEEAACHFSGGSPSWIYYLEVQEDV
jgi:hypothetical protein